MSKSIVSLLRQLGLVAAPAPCVLIVDDEAGAARYVRRVLSAKGYETVVASSGEAALDIAPRLERLDLLVTDVLMPGIGGDELAAQIRQRTPGVPVLYVTGNRSRLFGRRARLWYKAAVLAKPASPDALLEAVASLVSYQVRARLKDPSQPAIANAPAIWA